MLAASSSGRMSSSSSSYYYFLAQNPIDNFFSGVYTGGGGGRVLSTFGLALWELRDRWAHAHLGISLQPNRIIIRSNKQIKMDRCNTLPFNSNRNSYREPFFLGGGGGGGTEVLRRPAVAKPR